MKDYESVIAHLVKVQSARLKSLVNKKVDEFLNLVDVTQPTHFDGIFTKHGKGTKTKIER